MVTKSRSAVGIDPEQVTRIQRLVGYGKKYKSVNAFAIEAIDEKLDKEGA